LIFHSFGNWAVVDKWLAQMAFVPATGKPSLRVVLAGWPEDDPNWEGYFLEFRRAGGELRREICDYDYLDPETISSPERWMNVS